MAGEYASDYLHFLLTSVSLLVVAVPEGLPLAVTLALAFAVQRMLAEKNLVRRRRTYLEKAAFGQGTV